jgi:hypothetical protein
VRNQGKLACNSIIVFSSLFTLYLAQETHIIHKVEAPSQEQQVYTKKKQNHSKNDILKATFMCQNSGTKVTSKLHKILQEK